MTQAEKILIRYLSALSAALGAITAALAGYSTEAFIPVEIIVGLAVGAAGLSAFVASLTAEAVSRGFGVRRSD